MVTREKVFKETEQREIDLFHVKVCFLYCPSHPLSSVTSSDDEGSLFLFFIGN